MKPDEISEAEKWEEFNAFMEREAAQVARDEARRKRRDLARRIIVWLVVLLHLSFGLFLFAAYLSRVLPD